MGKVDKSDNSGDSDYSPGQDKMKKVRVTIPARKKAAASSLPTPDLTPTDPTFAAQLATYEQHGWFVGAAQHPYPLPLASQVQPSLHSPISIQSSLTEQLLPEQASTFRLKGMLQFEDEVLSALLRYSRRGVKGHCSRDTADLWFYILRLFFPADDGYEITASNYYEQASDDFPSASSSPSSNVEIPSGSAVTIQVWKMSKQFHPLHRQFTVTAHAPVLTILCGATEEMFTEHPAVRHINTTSTSAMDVLATTPLQTALHAQLRTALRQHEDSIAQGRNQAAHVRSVSGAVACGSMVRFFKVKMESADTGWLRAWSARGLDMVNGVPSEALACVESILLRIKEPNWKKRAAGNF